MFENSAERIERKESFFSLIIISFLPSITKQWAAFLWHGLGGGGSCRQRERLLLGYSRSSEIPSFGSIDDDHWNEGTEPRSWRSSNAAAAKKEQNSISWLGRLIRSDRERLSHGKEQNRRKREKRELKKRLTPRMNILRSWKEINRFVASILNSLCQGFLEKNIPSPCVPDTCREEFSNDKGTYVLTILASLITKRVSVKRWEFSAVGLS